MVLLILLVVLFGLWMLWGWLSVRNVEEPNYSVVSTNDTYELREYDPVLIAKTTVEGTMEEATNEGFRRIADYIFGNNTKSEGIAMTAPVTVEDQGEPIAMTVPVTSTASEAGSYTIAFVMPSKYSLENIPKPNNSNVVLEEVPSRTIAVLTFSGYVTEAKTNENKARLLEALTLNGLTNDGTYTLSQYNPPWTPWFMRRNEIWIEVETE